MPDHRVVTGLGGSDGQPLWVSDNVEEVLGLTAESILEHRSTIPAFSGDPTYDQIFAEEKEKIGPRLSFRSWLRTFQNGESGPIGVIALFLHNSDGEIENVVGAAWQSTNCPVCSRMFSGGPEVLRRAVLDLGQAMFASL
jgi:hypothetical protein